MPALLLQSPSGSDKCVDVVTSHSKFQSRFSDAALVGHHMAMAHGDRSNGTALIAAADKASIVRYASLAQLFYNIRI